MTTTGEEGTLARILAELQELRQQNAQLREEVNALTARQPQAPVITGPRPGAPAAPLRFPAEPGRTSRRGVLRAALGVAATAGAIALWQEEGERAAASNGNALVMGAANSGSSYTLLTFTGSGVGPIFIASTLNVTPTESAYPAALTGWVDPNNNGNINAGVDGYCNTSGGWGVVGRGNGTGVLALGGSGQPGLHAVGNGGIPTLPANNAAAVFAETAGTTYEATAVTGTITSTQPGSYAAGVRGVNNGTGGLGIGVWGAHAGSGWGGYFTSVSGIGVNTSGGTGTGVSASSSSGTAGQFVSTSGTGLTATSFQGEGLLAQGGTGKASIHAVGSGVAPGTAPATVALFAEGGSSYGVHSTTTSSSLAAVHGVNQSSGPGVRGSSGSGSIGVYGTGSYGVEGNGSNIGVRGLGTSYGAYATSAKGIGAFGQGATGGSFQGTARVGVIAQGTEAALRLVPTSSAGAPTTGAHTKGDILLDSGCIMYVCTASGTPGTWQKVGSQ